MRFLLALSLLLFAVINIHEVLAKPRYSSAGTGAAANAEEVSEGSEREGVKKRERDLLEDMLKESDVLQMLESEQKKHEKRLKEVQNRLERELQQVQEHFESVMVKLKKTEEQLEINLKNVEKSLIQQVKTSNEKSDSVSNSWRWPFFILLLLLAGLGGFFGNLYRKATKGLRAMD